MAKNKSLVKLAIIIPTYNERANIARLVMHIKHEVRQLKLESCTVLVVDDDSPDGTGAVVDNISKAENESFFRVECLHRQKKEGLGRAYIAGFRHVLRKNYTHVLQMDADFSHDPHYIVAFIEAAKMSDMVVGARYIAGGSTPDWSIRRRLLSRFGNVYAQLILRKGLHDYTGGYNLYTVPLLNSIILESIRSDGYGFAIEFKYKAILKAHHISEIPIIFRDRASGVSKLPKRTIISNLYLVIRLKFNK